MEFTVKLYQVAMKVLILTVVATINTFAGFKVYFNL